MRKTPFLEFNYTHMSHHLPKNLPVDKVVHKLIFLLLEYSANQVRSILWCLPYLQVIRNLGPP